MSKIISIGTAVPIYGTDQNIVLRFMQDAYNDSTASRKLAVLFHSCGIGKRHSVIPDFDASQPVRLLFKDNIIPVVAERLDLYKKHAVPLAMKAIDDCLEKISNTVSGGEITHLITVTCTGLYAPGIETELITQLNLPPDIFHTSVNFLGCNAAFHALKIGDMIARTEENAKILIVCVELCTLHFQPKNNNDNLLSNTIFGDGAAAVMITSDTFARQQHLEGLEIKGFYSLLLGRGKELMGWNITSVNFEMVLDSGIPEFIGDNVSDIVNKATNKWNIKSEDIGIWAVHPGEKKILDAIKKQMHLSDADLQCSYNVLSQYGNMSSPTILFILKEIFKQKPREDIFSVGFGPGLSIEAALLTYDE
jgi:predicted naringenin-chalcone synthase